MYSQLSCPNCRTPFTAEVHQVIDAGKNPELKERLLSGQLNVAVCPNCGSGGQMATALLFHDPDHEMFVVHVPQELNLNLVEREKLIGKLSQQAMEALPTEQRRAYMLQPQQVLTMQNLMEKVLETEGITPEMIERQKKQAELLQTLATADKDVADHLIKERGDEIDATFFAMLQAHIDSVANANDNKRLLQLTNLRARLMVETPIGRELEKHQIAVHALSREAKAQNGITPEMLLKHVLANLDDDGVIDALVAAGRSALSYQFFSLLTNEMERRAGAGEHAGAQKLEGVRERLLEVYDSMQAESKKILARADQTLQNILSAEDRESAIKDNLSRVDEPFMYLLSANIAEAEAGGNKELFQALGRLQAEILSHLENQYPPEVILLNQLMEANEPDEQRRILDANQDSLFPGLIKMIDNVANELDETAQAELGDRLRAIKSLVELRL
jgi:hypothetical protein